MQYMSREREMPIHRRGVRQLDVCSRKPIRSPWQGETKIECKKKQPRKLMIGSDKIECRRKPRRKPKAGKEFEMDRTAVGNGFRFQAADSFIRIKNVPKATEPKPNGSSDPRKATPVYA
jgi:hypothetical protein